MRPIVVATFLVVRAKPGGEARALAAHPGRAVGSRRRGRAGRSGCSKGPTILSGRSSSAILLMLRQQLSLLERFRLRLGRGLLRLGQGLLLCLLLLRGRCRRLLLLCLLCLLLLRRCRLQSCPLRLEFDLLLA